MQFLNESSSVWSDFNLKAEVVTCFIKHNDTILLLKNRDPVDAPFLWGVPGGKVESVDLSCEDALKHALVREVFEETGIHFLKNQLCYHSTRFGRVPGWDYKLHIYQINVACQPSIILSQEHDEYIWVPLTQFTQYPLIKGQAEAFHIVFLAI